MKSTALAFTRLGGTITVRFGAVDSGTTLQIGAIMKA